MPNRPVAVAREKTRKVQRDIRVAESGLHASNQLLAESGVGKVSTPATVQAAVAQNVEVEVKLHAAVDELAAVTDLLKIAEARNPGHGDDTGAGHRSGEGVSSVMAHLEGAGNFQHEPKQAPPGATGREE